MKKVTIDREKLKYIIAFSLIAVVVLLLCIAPTRAFLIGIFGYAIFAYVVGVLFATILLALGKRIAISKKRAAIYLLLFATMVITLHIVTAKQAFLDNGEFVNTQFAEYLWGPFTTYETVGGVVLSMLTFYVVPMGYLASLIIFFIAAATLGLLALWPLLVYREKSDKKIKIFEDSKKKVAETDVEDIVKDKQPNLISEKNYENLGRFSVDKQPVVDKEPIVISTRPTAPQILFDNAEKPKEEKKTLMPNTLKRELTEYDKTFVMDRNVMDSTLPQDLQLDNDRIFSGYDCSPVYTGCEEPTYYAEDNNDKQEKDVVITDYDRYVQSLQKEAVEEDIEESGDSDYVYVEKEDDLGDWDMGEDEIGDDVIDVDYQDPVTMQYAVDMPVEPKVVTVTVDEPAIVAEIEEQEIEEDTEIEEVVVPKVVKPVNVVETKPVQPAKKVEEKKEEAKEEPYKPYVYTAPPISMLAEPTGISGEVEDFQATKKCLDEIMLNFKIDAEVTSAIKGPTVTRYELSIGPTVNVNRFEKIKDNIAMRLMVESVLILAPIPGKNAVGIEVPNKTRRMVGLREIIGNQKFIMSKGMLSFALGTTVDNEPYFFDLATAPHMLVAGATGSGKSCGINSLLISLLYKYSPDDLRFILIDPKRVELLSYCGLPHMLIPNTICEVDKAVNAIKWLVGEMDRRYSVLSAARAVNIKQYNEMCVAERKKKMPNIVLVIDEMADLMLRARNSIEENICRIAAVGRACGIHLVIATQRPDATVITGLIKSNIPTCIAFAVKSALESNIILGQGEGGAKSLLGNGDALFKTSSMRDQLRFQGAFVSSNEVRQITDFIRANNKCDFDEKTEESMLKTEEKPDALSAGESDSSDKDSDKSDDYEKLCIKVLKSFILQNRASVSMVQSQHGRGYVKACKIVNTLTEWGVISEQEPGGKARRVLIDMDEFNERFGNTSTEDIEDDD